MALTKAIEKLKKYYQRLEVGDAKKIKPSHIRKVMNKLSKKEEILPALERARGSGKPAVVEIGLIKF